MLAPAAVLFAAFPSYQLASAQLSGTRTSIESGEEYRKSAKTIN
jgi:hypothetical protein